MECKLFFSPGGFIQLYGTFDSITPKPTDNLHAGWGTSETCRDDGRILQSILTRILTVYIAVCLSYQVQFTLRAKDTTEERSYSNEAKDGFEFCRALCHDAQKDDCVGHQWVEEIKKYNFLEIKSPELLNIISDVYI